MPSCSSAVPSEPPRRRSAGGSWCGLLLLLFASAAAAQGAETLGAPAPPRGPRRPGPAHSLYFVMNQHATTADRGSTALGDRTALGELYDTNVAAFSPRLDTSAVKVLASSELGVLVGEGGELFGEDLDAMGVRHLYRPVGRHITTRDLVLSTEVGWGTARPEQGTDGVRGALDGSLFSLDRSWDGAELLVRLFLREEHVLDALGQPPADEGGDVDIDAFVQDTEGNVYLSFRHDELVNGQLLADDGVVGIPRLHLGYNSLGNIVATTPGSAFIVLDKPAVDALVDRVGLQTASGHQVHTLGDLQALALDPAGGRFPPVEACPHLPDGVPHLFFNGQRLGATVLSTRGGGSIATLDGHRLGRSVLSGAPLGLEPQSTTSTAHDLNALLVRPRARPRPVLDVQQSRVYLGFGEVPTFLFGNFTPHGWTWVLATGLFPASQSLPAATLAPADARYPHLFLTQPLLALPLALDGLGRARLELPVDPPGVDFWIVLQAYEFGSGVLSPPAAVWCPRS